MLHRSLALALATAAASVSSPALAAAVPGVPAHGPAATHLVITVTESGDSDGTYELYCDPARGRHPQPLNACDTLRQAERETSGGDLFAPVPDNALCTYMYGGPAVAHVEGTWRGERVDARFDRSDGCEIARWDRLVPVLPRIAGDRA